MCDWVRVGEQVGEGLPVSVSVTGCVSVGVNVSEDDGVPLEVLLMV